MKIFNVLVKKNSDEKIEDIVLLKEGFSWAAFFFSGLWFLYHKMWREFLAIVLINIAIASLGKIFSDLDQILLEIALAFIIALNANYWLCEHLKKKKYEFVGLVFGDDCVSARLRFVQNLEAGHKLVASDFDYSILNPKLHRKMMKVA